MKQSWHFKKVYKWLALSFAVLFFNLSVNAQSVEFPTETPPYNELSPWGYDQVGTSWDTSPYLPFIYQGVWFRLLIPEGVSYDRDSNTWTYDDPNAEYPIIMFQHGAGERGLDNNNQLKHGGKFHRDAVASGRYNGFALYWQTESGYISSDKMASLINGMIANLPVDKDRVYIHGLSRGGTMTWEFLRDYPELIAASFAMSSASGSFVQEDMMHVPVRLAQGGLDKNPSPDKSDDMVNLYNQYGGNLEYFYFSHLGHGTWNTCYNLSDFFEWFLEKRKYDIHVFGGLTEVCPGDPVNIKIGFSAGFDGYEWRKDGVVINGATANDFVVTEFGNYEGRFRRGSEWTPWSAPVEIKLKDATVTPPIAAANLQSNVLPATDGKTEVTLELPEGYETYVWKKVGSDAVIGTERTLLATSIGEYIASVTEFGGCSSSFSDPFKVIDASGTVNIPDPAVNARASANSKTSVTVAWDQNPTPANNESAFEVYRSTVSGSAYTLVNVSTVDAGNFVDTDLVPDTEYFYVVRAVNDNGAAALSNEASVTTQVDEVAPNAPTNLRVVKTSSNSVELAWDAATDDVGVFGYDVYVNGQKLGATINTTYIAYGLTEKTLYAFSVKARDESGNESPASAQVTAATIINGLSYAYYEGVWGNGASNPDFDNETPVATGKSDNFSINAYSGRASNYFGYVFEGYILLPESKEYIFWTGSDDGSELYIDGVRVVWNNRLQGTTYRACPTENCGAYNPVPVFLEAGAHQIKVTYFERTGGNTLYTRLDQNVNDGQNAYNNAPYIPDAMLSEAFTYPATPGLPSNLVANAVSYDAIDLSWTNTDAAQVEVYRKAAGESEFKIVATVDANGNYQDSDLSPSTNYQYQIKGISNNGSSSISSTVSATTTNLPSIPAAPSNLIVSDATGTTLTLTWNDNSSDEDAFEVYKALGDNAYDLLTTLPANAGATVVFEDTQLFPHTTYKYRVLSKNVGGSSSFSNELIANTDNAVPVIDVIDDLSVRYDENKSFIIQVSDADEDAVAINANNFPSFVELVDYGNGQAEIIISPTVDIQGVYNDLEVNANDGFGGISSELFNLTVNDNYSPVIAPSNSVSLKETEVDNLVLTASDQNGDALTWEVVNAPSFISQNVNGSNALELAIAPGLTDAGNYEFTVKINDGKGGQDIRLIAVEVVDFDPNYLVYVNFGGTSNAASPWNNALTATPNSGSSFGDLVNDNGISTAIAVALESNWGGASDTGGKSPGLYPNEVMSSYYWMNNSTQQIRITGLNPTYLYNFSFMASRNSNGDRTTVYTINGNNASIDATQNTNNLAVLNGIVSDGNGEVVLTVSNGNGAAYGYLNAMVIESVYNDGTAPAAPTNVSASLNGDNQVELTWTDIAYNETAYNIYRTPENGTEQLATTLSANSNAFTDAPIGHTNYTYRVEASNDDGTASAVTTSVYVNNNLPVFEPIQDVTALQGISASVYVSASDADEDALSLSVVTAPSFVSFIPGVGNDGTGTFDINPTMEDIGTHLVTLKATDVEGETSISFTINVTNTEVTSILVNFNKGSNQASPWNNMDGTPNVGLIQSGLLDEDGAATSISVELLDAWKGDNNLGVVTGNDSGVYPDNVMMSAFWESSSTAKRIAIRGLDNNLLYDFDFFSSRDGDGDRTTEFTINGITRSINAAYNSNNTANFVGLTPVGGEIIVEVSRAASASYSYLNAMVIKEYEDDGLPAAPTALISEVLSQNSIKLSWNDNASNESGYQVFRSTGNSNSFALLTNLGSNATSYTDVNLSENTTYVYKVRAVAVAGNSGYSNETSASTYEYAVSINFNDFNGAALPWNNITNYLTEGAVVTNLKDDQNNITNLSMTIVQEFTGDNPSGMNTGNESGVLPDAVMEGSYWLDPGQSAVVRISGLSFLHTYNFGFFASRNGGGNRTTDYTVNGQTVSLNASYNTSDLVQLKDITPDINGNVEITVSTADGASFGYLNALIIQATRIESAGSKLAGEQVGAGDLTESIAVYPNPFENEVTIQSIADGVERTLQIQLLDTKGQIVIGTQVKLDGFAASTALQLEQYNLKEGLYILNLQYSTGEHKVMRLMKK